MTVLPPTTGKRFWATTPGILSIVVIVGGVLFIGARLVEKFGTDFRTEVTCSTEQSSGQSFAVFVVMVENKTNTTRDASVDIMVRDAASGLEKSATVQVNGIKPDLWQERQGNIALDGQVGAIECEVTEVT